MMSFVRNSLSLSFAVAALASVALTGCSPKQTFPPTVANQPRLDTNLAPLPQLCAIGIKSGHEYSAASDESIVYNLPPGMSKPAWKTVGANLPASARPSQPNDKNVVSVEEVRIDGGTAQVDVLIPNGEIYQLVTIHLSGSPFGPWKVTYVQPWMLRSVASKCNNPFVAPTEVATGAELPSATKQ
ncbi:MAG: hypothetical protein U0572_05580 [Phycisphaerales bacterium]